MRPYKGYIQKMNSDPIQKIVEACIDEKNRKKVWQTIDSLAAVLNDSLREGQLTQQEIILSLCITLSVFSNELSRQSKDLFKILLCRIIEAYLDDVAR